MENLNREAILRMLSGKTGNSSSSGGGGDIDLAGYATMIWVTENFVSIDFFRELFRAYDSNSQEILPNDTTSVVASIKAMVGTWTEQYLTALGNAGGGGGGGGGAQYLNDLLDVQLTTPLTDGQALVYNATLQKWVNGAAGVNMTTVWNALSGSTNEQINASHLSTALSGYVTTSAISDMATQTWVGQQGFATQTWVTSNFITIAYFDRLFRAYNDSTLVSHNDTTSTINNIKAMFGFWTDFYLSALGTGGISTVGIGLSQLNDVTLTSPTSGQALVYDTTSNKWVNGNVQAGATALASLTDVTLTSLDTNQVLIYNGNYWVNSTLKTINGVSIIGTGDIPASGGGSVYIGTTLTQSYPATQNLTGIGSVSANGNYTISISNTDDRAFQILNPLNSLYVGLNYLQAYIWVPTNLDLRLGTNNTSRIEIKNSGNVGIGTINPVQKLDVDGNISLANYGYISTGNSRFLYHNIADGDLPDLSIMASGENPGQIQFRPAGMNSANYYMTLLSSGRVGLGVTNPLYYLDLVYSDIEVGMHIRNTSSSNIAYTILRMGNDAFETCAAIFLNSSTRSGDGEVNMLTIRNDNGKLRLGNERNPTYMACNVGIMTSSPSYTLHVVGTIYATGAITALSDARKKNITGEAKVSVLQIASAPAVQFLWKDKERRMEGQQVGTLAQYWQAVLPEVVSDKGGELSMQYGVAALVSSIIIARKVVNHEDRIKQLEKENKELKKRLNIA